MRTVRLLRAIGPEIFKDADKLRALDNACKAGMAKWDQFDAVGKTMATLFFEPSTRTRLSFEAAMLRLGGNVITANDESSSLMKGESISDTLRTVGLLSDLLVVRSSCPQKDWGDPQISIINAGDGGNSHPTQALLDTYTILRHKGRISPLTIGIVGDLYNSRTIKSLTEYLSVGANDFIGFDSTGHDNKLGPNPGYYDNTSSRCSTRNDIEEFERLMPQFDVLYLNRVQNERHSERGKAVDPENDDPPTFVLDRRRLGLLRQDCVILNPGPRRGELPDLIDSRIKFWEQIENGFYIRMALLRHVFKEEQNVS